MRAASLLLICLLASTNMAFAEPQRICEDLRARLADLPETLTTGRQSQTSDAAARQRMDIDRLENAYQQEGCDAYGSVMQSDRAALCDRMEMTLDRMHENLRFLMQRRDRMERNGGSDIAMRQRLLDALQDHGCDLPLSADVDTIGGNRRRSNETQNEAALGDDTNGDQDYLPQYENGDGPRFSPFNGDRNGPMQTVCVRTCDGGFFPLTANATEEDFAGDADKCAKMCPGIGTELFLRMPGQESGNMVSASNGAPYSAMPYAFGYQKRAPGAKSSCSCNLNAYYDQIRREKALTTPDQNGNDGSIISIAPPAPPAALQKQAPAPQPNTATAAPPPPQKPVAERPYDPSAQVRQVGPTFLPDDKNKIDLKHPAAPGPQPQQ